MMLGDYAEFAERQVKGYTRNGKIVRSYRRKRRDRGRRREQATGAAQVAGSLAMGKVAVESGGTRLTGVRLEQHSSSRGKIKEILKNGGWVDPNKGGSGGAIALAESSSRDVYKRAPDFVQDLKRYGYITGRHAKDPRWKVNIPAANVGWRRLQRGFYRSTGAVPLKKIKNPIAQRAAIGAAYVPAQLGIVGRTAYVGGTDDWFSKTFQPDVDDFAMRSPNRFKVYGSRWSAAKAGIKRNGGVLKTMKAAPGRVGAGVAILGAGGYGAYRLGKTGVNNLSGKRKSRKRRDR